MPTYGKYQTGKELHLTAAGSIYTATPSEASLPTIVKVCQPDPALFNEDEIARQVEQFLYASRLQQKVASAGSSHWAPIHDVAEFTGGAYCVTSQYRQSVQTLNDAKTPCDPRRLFAIADGVVKGLLELKQCCNRSHGKIKPTNILLETAKSGGGRAILTDPSGAPKPGSEAADL